MANNGHLMDSRDFLGILFSLKQNGFSEESLKEYLQFLVSSDHKMLKTLGKFKTTATDLMNGIIHNQMNKSNLEPFFIQEQLISFADNLKEIDKSLLSSDDIETIDLLFKYLENPSDSVF